MDRETPYEHCVSLDHNRSSSSSDGIHIIEDCHDCRLRFIMPAIGDPPDRKPITIWDSVVFKQ